MRKVILDFMDVIDEMIPEDAGTSAGDCPVTLADAPENRLKPVRELVQDYIAGKMGFPEYYGKNLDALYDCLTDIGEPTAVGFFLPMMDLEDLSIDLMMYLDRVREVFLDAERDNSEYLAVITAECSQPEPGDEDPDRELSALLEELRLGGHL